MTSGFGPEDRGSNPWGKTKAINCALYKKSFGGYTVDN